MKALLYEAVMWRVIALTVSFLLTGCATQKSQVDYSRAEISWPNWKNADHVASFINPSDHAHSVDIYCNDQLIIKGIPSGERRNVFIRWNDDEVYTFQSICLCGTNSHTVPSGRVVDRTDWPGTITSFKVR